MAQQSYLLGMSDMGEPYGTHVDTPHLAMPLKGGKLGLRQALARRYATATGTPPSGQALADTMMVLEGAAAEQVPQRLHLRVADRDGRIYLDMGDTDGQVIVIGGGQTGIYPLVTPGGWQLIGRTPLALFNPHEMPPTLLRPGDSVRFVPQKEGVC